MQTKTSWGEIKSSRKERYCYKEGEKQVFFGGGGGMGEVTEWKKILKESTLPVSPPCT